MNFHSETAPSENNREAYPIYDREADADLYDESQKAETMKSAVDRLQVVKNLRFTEEREKGIAERGDEFLKKHFLEYRESNPSPYGVTLGIEIEIPKESVLPKNWMNLTDVEKKKFLTKLKEKYKQTKKLGMPAGTDQFWEFASEPANYPTTLARETQALIEMNLIPKEYRKFPLHVTIGGVTFLHENDFLKENNTHLLARVLDATAWETDAERLIAPYKDKNSDWTSHRAESGIRERNLDQIKQQEGIKIERAVEFRTMQMQSLFGLERYLGSIYYLGSALKAYQNPDKSDPTVKKLSKVWRQFAGRSDELFSKINLPNPFVPWTLETGNPDEHSPFKVLAKILEKSEKEPKGKESEFVHEIRQLVIETRKEVKDIIEEDRDKNRKTAG